MGRIGRRKSKVQSCDEYERPPVVSAGDLVKALAAVASTGVTPVPWVEPVYRRAFIIAKGLRRAGRYPKRDRKGLPLGTLDVRRYIRDVADSGPPGIDIDNRTR